MAKLPQPTHRAIDDDRNPTFANGLLVQGVRVDEYANSDNPVMLSDDRALAALFNAAERIMVTGSPIACEMQRRLRRVIVASTGNSAGEDNQSGASLETIAMARVQRADNTPERSMQNLSMHRAPHRSGSYGRSASLVSSNEAGSTNGGSDISASQSRMSVGGIARRGVQGLMVPAVTMYPCSNFWRANLWASSSVGKLSLCLERRCADALRTVFGTSNETYHVLKRSVGTGLSDLFSLWGRLSLRVRPACAFGTNWSRVPSVTPRGAEIQ
ncbi:hypothetical protein ABIB99_008245 [Bradyrhizobium sp. LA6.1]|uniref:hypothetical protein n=1 Tax=Bradyrhizobium sp. LA6.1 TaxID=3156378 RepID=UPI00339462A0